jgi:Sulfotransferase family
MAPNMLACPNLRVSWARVRKPDMSATIFEILETVRDLGWNSEKDFVLGPGQAVSLQTLVNHPDWSLYSLDLSRGLAWFVELPPGFDLAASAFAFRDQRQLARRVLQVSLDDMIDMSRRIAPPTKVIFIFNIGRCGSTLVSHVLNTCPRVWGLSEPIAFPRLIMTNYNSDERLTAQRERLVELIRACTRLQFRPPGSSGYDIFALKFHSQCLFQADLYFEAFPEAAFVFLYRDAISWTKSWYQMAQKYGYAALLTGPSRVEMWNCVTAADDLAHLRPYVDVEAEQVALEDGLVHGWGRNMEEYSRFLKAGVPFLALRYNEMNRDRATSLAHLFAHCGLPTEDAVAGLAAFERDSQAGDIVSHDVVAEAMSEAQVERLQRVLVRRPTFGNPALRLDDIYSRAAPT